MPGKRQRAELATTPTNTTISKNATPDMTTKNPPSQSRSGTTKKTGTKVPPPADTPEPPLPGVPTLATAREERAKKRARRETIEPTPITKKARRSSKAVSSPSQDADMIEAAPPTTFLAWMNRILPSDRFSGLAASIALLPTTRVASPSPIPVSPRSAAPKQGVRNSRAKGSSLTGSFTAFQGSKPKDGPTAAQAPAKTPNSKTGKGKGVVKQTATADADTAVTFNFVRNSTVLAPRPPSLVLPLLFQRDDMLFHSDEIHESFLRDTALPTQQDSVHSQSNLNRVPRQEPNSPDIPDPNGFPPEIPGPIRPGRLLDHLANSIIRSRAGVPSDGSLPLSQAMVAGMVAPRLSSRILQVSESASGMPEEWTRAGAFEFVQEEYATLKRRRRRH
ncbi:hypothetical protein EJ08DRAFT_702213 [Tothia fuscella]|uniref:Uncharacterized protein n=1 Tax=Tothia fuscella TaxID=1048955 RepID=A0A9P4TTD5_9PEZI|nr:hypothetical protein EJ08DRAFT_702213 [Tothia fuscella]